MRKPVKCIGSLPPVVTVGKHLLDWFTWLTCVWLILYCDEATWEFVCTKTTWEFVCTKTTWEFVCTTTTCEFVCPKTPFEVSCCGNTRSWPSPKSACETSVVFARPAGVWGGDVRLPRPDQIARRPTLLHQRRLQLLRGQVDEGERERERRRGQEKRRKWREDGDYTTLSWSPPQLQKFPDDDDDKNKQKKHEKKYENTYFS